MSNLGLFYVIIIAFFAVPMLGAFVVVGIRGVTDYRHFILFGGALLLTIILLYGIKSVIKMFRKVKADGLAADQDARKKTGYGQPVEISIFNGLLTLNYGGRQRQEKFLPFAHENRNQPEFLPYMTENKENHPPDPIQRLKALSDLKIQGIITEDEFRLIKAKLLHDLNDSQDSKTEPSPR